MKPRTPITTAILGSMAMAFPIYSGFLMTSNTFWGFAYLGLAILYATLFVYSFDMKN